MPAEIRAVTPTDLPSIVELLMHDAERRQAHDPILWALADDAREKVAEAVKSALAAEMQPFRQKWLVAEACGNLVGIIHSMLLPVPPIYAGKWGDPGLLLPESFVTQDAPPGTIEALVEAAEADLRAVGVKLLLASFVCGDEWRSAFRDRGYRPLTLYMSKSGFENAVESRDVRTASEDDIEGIVIRSAEHRAILRGLDEFWTPHADADARFEHWMKKSLTFKDRSMLVTGSPDMLDGYLVAQPASRLHFPPAHDISATGVIDDFFHREYADPARRQDAGNAASALIQAAEASFTARGVRTAFVVCPAAWTSKVAVLNGAGYGTAMVWMIKR